MFIGEILAAIFDGLAAHLQDLERVAVPARAPRGCHARGSSSDPLGSALPPGVLCSAAPSRIAATAVSVL